MTNNDFKKFLSWLKNRLVYKYGESDPEIITALNCLINNHYFVLNHLVPEKDLISLCRKYYKDFDYERDEDSFIDIGYTEAQRENLKEFVQNIGKDLLEIYTS